MGDDGTGRRRVGLYGREERDGGDELKQKGGRGIERTRETNEGGTRKNARVETVDGGEGRGGEGGGWRVPGERV